MTAETEDYPPPHPMNQFGHASSVRDWLVLVAAAIGFYLCYRLSLPFLSALTWALVLAILLVPLHRRVEQAVPKADLTAFVSVTATVIAAGIPLFLLVQQLVQEAASGASHLQGKLGTLEWGDFLGNHPRVAELGTWIGQRLNTAGALDALARWLTEQSTTLLRGSVNQVVGLTLTFYMLFYFLRDRENGLKALVAYSPLTPAETMRVTFRFVETVRASIFGTVVVGFVQLARRNDVLVARPANPCLLGFCHGRARDLSIPGSVRRLGAGSSHSRSARRVGKRGYPGLMGRCDYRDGGQSALPYTGWQSTPASYAGHLYRHGWRDHIVRSNRHCARPGRDHSHLELVEIVTLRSKLGRDMLRQNQTAKAPGEP